MSFRERKIVSPSTRSGTGYRPTNSGTYGKFETDAVGRVANSHQNRIHSQKRQAPVGRTSDTTRTGGPACRSVSRREAGVPAEAFRAGGHGFFAMSVSGPKLWIMRNYIDEVEAAYMTSRRQGDMMRDPARERGTHDDRRNRYADNPSEPGAEMHGRTEPKRQTMDYHQPAGSMNREESNHCGKGPKNYKRSDERIKELVCERLCDDPEVDASNIEVEVKNAEVILRGEVNDKSEKYMAEDLAASVTGVANVENLLRVNNRQLA